MATRRERHFEVWTVVFLGIWASGLLAITTDDGVPKSTDTESCMPPAMGYEIQNITKGSWTFRETGQNCVGSVAGPNGSLSNCTYTVAFCQKLNNCSGGSVCVETFNGTGNNQTVKHVQGGFIANPFRVTDTSLNGGFQARFDKGDNFTKPDGSSCQLSAVINFDCNRILAWVPNSDKDTTPVPQAAVEQVKFDKENCQVQATFWYAGACIAIVPASTISEDLTAGTVLIIIFFVSLTLYFCCGILINLVRGFRGRDVLPQSEFWTQLPVLIADGFLFTCRCGTEEKNAYDSI
ncbi:cation-dependent mannose-6-phosphate receptor-like isoform X1 [Mizuhopecten yessoensis]|uniref:cation-dependent mannose-6-phosphate receptor-like isoform X1 n=1 Tax=Mizuhopecten yessoensis TaxID=6573 RepID=UPI000B45A748|nr:cation-dependent mannose-6-phosphate receptor-like isoform X1 [Mizuhopecten yessoensis]